MNSVVAYMVFCKEMVVTEPDRMPVVVEPEHMLVVVVPDRIPVVVEPDCIPVAGVSGHMLVVVVLDHMPVVGVPDYILIVVENIEFESVYTVVASVNIEVVSSVEAASDIQEE